MVGYKIKTSLREVDCTKYEPIVRHPHITRLNSISQLSFVDKVYRGAKHSRLDHTIFVYHFTDEITNHLLEKGCINENEKTNTEIASIVHDLGHMPRSHASEFMVEQIEKLKGKEYDHKIRATDLIEKSKKKDRSGRTLKECIKDCNGNVNIVKEIILKQHPLSPIISHNTLGSDKTGYVLLDSQRTGYFWAMPYFLDIFPEYFFDGKTLGLENDEKEPQIEDLQRAYQNMYIRVYFHPTVRFYERLFEKAIQEVVENNIVSTEELWGLEEFELENLLKNNERTKKLFEKIRYEEMDEKILSVNYNADDERRFKSLVDFYSNPLHLSEAEKRIAAEFGCESNQIVCNLTVIPSRIIPEDVHIFSWGKSVFEKYPSHYQSLIEKANLSTSLNIFKEPKVKLNKKRCKEILTDEVPQIP